MRNVIVSVCVAMLATTLAPAVAQTVGTNSKDEPAINLEYRKLIEAQIKTCREAITPADFGSTPAEAAINFNLVTGVAGPCVFNQGLKVQNQAISKLDHVNLMIEAANAALQSLERSCVNAECAFAAALLTRSRELQAEIRQGRTPADMDKYRWDSSAKAYGRDINKVASLPIIVTSPPERATETAKRLALYIPVVGALTYAILPIERENWAILRDDATRNAARWDAYAFGGGWDRVQLPWELALNGWLYQRSEDKRLEEDPNSPGRVPESALIFLHPSIGITPFDDAGGKSGLTGVVEAIGWSSWDYDDETGARKDEFGVSLAAVYQERDQGKDWSPGIVVRLPYGGLNVVWSRVEMASGDDEDVFGFSIDPTSLFGEKSPLCMFGLAGC